VPLCKKELLLQKRKSTCLNPFLHDTHNIIPTTKTNWPTVEKKYKQTTNERDLF
jgi:hypothetical protein